MSKLDFMVVMNSKVWSPNRKVHLKSKNCVKALGQKSFIVLFLNLCIVRENN